MSFSVVRFEDGSTSEVPTIWLLNKKECWWPNRKNVSQLIVKMEVPNKKTWSVHPVTVELTSVTLEKARKKAEDPDYTTSEEYDNPKLRRKVLKKKTDTIFDYGEETVDSSEREESSPEVPREKGLLSPPHLDSPTHEVTLDPPNENIHINNEIIEQVDDQMYNNINDMPIEIINGSYDEKLDRLMDIMLEIREDIRVIKNERVYMQNNNQSDDTYAEVKKLLPIKSIDEIHILENFLDGENVTLFKNYLQSIGGSGPKDYIHRAYKRIILDETAVKCSWMGQRNNYKISSLKSVKLLNDVVCSTFHLREKEFETISSEWFRHANQRLKRAESKNE